MIQFREGDLDDSGQILLTTPALAKFRALDGSKGERKDSSCHGAMALGLIPVPR